MTLPRFPSIPCYIHTVPPLLSYPPPPTLYLPAPNDPAPIYSLAPLPPSPHQKGRLKCTGRTVHTKGRFFTLYGDKAAGRATRMDCRDVFDSVVFFGKACWVGKKEDNPSEEPLPLPESLQVIFFFCGRCVLVVGCCVVVVLQQAVQEKRVAFVLMAANLFTLGPFGAKCVA